ncbi:Crp/Fnr family transcriptional regulator [Paenibacillus filicis]|uniref:Crp/Fnr family transcriptional regulator n=1 Tax=Paenibacillus gyeongsangnamensis TaxID=3388067 RepID=A0ABT4QEZ2_9BACL|nr:Crp/Fnr family transcriptional regulator [Paenibacillus filicis]MCZ8515260.1 Crp/Fnr family transcriptional regulator [Paenibacillus filicis]
MNCPMIYKKGTVNQLQGIRQYFSEENFERLAGIMYSKRVKKGTHLFWEGDLPEYWYYVKKGSVKITKSADNGSSITLYRHQDGDLIGHADCIPNSVHSFNAEVLEDSELGLIQQKDLEVLLWQHGDLAVEFMRWLGLMHRMTQTKFRDLMLFGKPGALCSLLIRLNNSYGEACGDRIRIGVKMNNSEVAEMIGATRESVNRMLSDMKKEEVIDMDNGHVIIKDLDYLRDVCHCENCPKDICRV